jgi:hypothetical protein
MGIFWEEHFIVIYNYIYLNIKRKNIIFIKNMTPDEFVDFEMIDTIPIL